MQKERPVSLVLDNGMVFNGYSFGYEKPTAGEVVFSTAMVGYPESLTDPSYSGQILTITFPLVGNYGVPADNLVDGISEFHESEKIHTSGVVVSDY
ncbi:MAG: carbamoyl-phosphate synthase domain-containing protein, partial [Bacteroidales bacterium]